MKFPIFIAHSIDDACQAQSIAETLVSWGCEVACLHDPESWSTDYWISDTGHHTRVVQDAGVLIILVSPHLLRDKLYGYVAHFANESLEQRLRIDRNIAINYILPVIISDTKEDTIEELLYSIRIRDSDVLRPTQQIEEDISAEVFRRLTENWGIDARFAQMHPGTDVAFPNSVMHAVSSERRKLVKEDVRDSKAKLEKVRAAVQAVSSERRMLVMAEPTLEKVPTDVSAVECSVFAPPRSKPGTDVFVQAFFHEESNFETAETRATLFDEGAALRQTKTLNLAVPCNARLEIILEPGPGAEVDDPHESLVWTGKVASVAFRMHICSDATIGSIISRVKVVMNGAPVGSISFKTECSRSEEQQGSSSTIVSHEARKYSHAFVSYSSKDRVKVLNYTQVLAAAGIEVFQDVLKLNPGERWERRLYKEIDKCDLFLLFWSQSARASEWVLKEARYAKERRKDHGSPDLSPVILEGPPPVIPPDDLSDLHFDDRVRYYIYALEHLQDQES